MMIVPLMLLSSVAGETNVYTINEVNVGGIKVNHTKVSIDDGSFVVSGQMHRKYVTRSYFGHVDIFVLDSNRNLIEKISTKGTLPFFGRSKRSKTRFKAEFTTIPPEGSTIYVTFHEQKLSRTGQFDCG
jgi:hypothetical protein